MDNISARYHAPSISANALTPYWGHDQITPTHPSQPLDCPSVDNTAPTPSQLPGVAITVPPKGQKRVSNPIRMAGSSRQIPDFPNKRPKTPLGFSSLHTLAPRPPSLHDRRLNPSQHRPSSSVALHPRVLHDTYRASRGSVTVAEPMNSPTLDRPATDLDLQGTIKVLRDETKKLQLRNKAMIDDCLEKDDRILLLEETVTQLQRELRTSSRVKGSEGASTDSSRLALSL